MKERLDLLIGICTCSQGIYQGKLRCRTVQVGRKLFSLREVSIEDTASLRCLNESRCHFFLDVHMLKESSYETAITRLMRVPQWTTKHNLLYSSGFESTNYGLWTTRRQPLSPDEVLKTVYNILRILATQRKLKKWLYGVDMG